MTNVDISARVCEIRAGISALIQQEVVWREIADRNERLRMLQERWDFLREAFLTLVEERGAELADKVAGGGTGIAGTLALPQEDRIAAEVPGMLRLTRSLRRIRSLRKSDAKKMLAGAASRRFAIRIQTTEHDSLSLAASR